MPSRPLDPSPSPVLTSEEQTATVADGVDICFQTFGDPAADPLLLVMGLGGPMTWWDAELCVELAEQGFYVIRYDNRDTGRSSRAKGRVTRGHLLRAFAGLPAQAPYSIGDLASDAFGLLDHLGIDSAHVAGISMGGMIAQTMALEAPERVLSLASIMSTTGRRTVGHQSPRLLPTLIAGRGPERDSYIEGSVGVWKLIGSPRFPQSNEKLAKRAGDTYDRGVSRSGVLRQMMAVLTQRDRTRDLRKITAPTLVMHGLADPMVHVSGGRATAAAIPGARLVLIQGWAHDLPPALFGTFAEAIRKNAN